ncbi:hypothetical protein H310_07036 [Aphanomyces invadans]|uniref:Calmodulin n=1 Tax=Aphanomyces invadans TaxID=157072 RepID=A0A024U497_9STRA|nr:hypothetical protein H310_07036 [Aphanomyces invadans]ETW00398.1 hypothetical protein H310_07036 [Aphanomyces invadans]|eukprot:XP_008870533.1 hypothetical protein H310_07036 [Aphanomyces invadans]
MASRYAKNIKVPAEFPELLRSFAREVLRQQDKVKTRADILQFGIKYFTDVTEKNSGVHNGPQNEKEVYMTMTDDEIEEYMWQIFRASDPGSVGDLDEGEFKRVFHEIGDYLRLHPLELKKCAAEADEMDNGTFSYASFIPSALRVISTLKKKRNIESHDAGASKEVIVATPHSLSHGLLRDEFESLLREILHNIDTDNTGSLSRTEFMGCLQDADLGLTRKETNLVLFDTPSDEAGRVAYNDVIPIVFDVLVHAAANDLLDMPRTEDQIETVLTRALASGDEDSTGFLSFAAIKTLLRSAGLGLTRIQIIALMSEAQEEEDDAVAYERFVKNISTMALHFLDYDHQAKMAQIVPVYRSTEEYFTVQGMNQHEFENALGIAFEAIDETHRGSVPRHEVVEAIQNAFPKISSKHVSTLLALGDVDANGDMEYAVTIHNGFQALQWIQEYEALGKQ